MNRKEEYINLSKELEDIPCELQFTTTRVNTRLNKERKKIFKKPLILIPSIILLFGMAISVHAILQTSSSIKIPETSEIITVNETGEEFNIIFKNNLTYEPIGIEIPQTVLDRMDDNGNAQFSSMKEVETEIGVDFLENENFLSAIDNRTYSATLWVPDKNSINFVVVNSGYEYKGYEYEDFDDFMLLMRVEFTTKDALSTERPYINKDPMAEVISEKYTSSTNNINCEIVCTTVGKNNEYHIFFAHNKMVYDIFLRLPIDSDGFALAKEIVDGLK